MRKLAWPNWRTIRMRLTLWYVLLLALTVLLFSSYLYLQLDRSLLDQADADLRTTAHQSLVLLSEDTARPVFAGTADAQMTMRRLTEGGYAVRLVALDGTVWNGFGGYTQVPAWIPTRAGFTTLMTEEDDWRVYAEPIEMPAGHPIGWLQAARSLGAVQDALESLFVQILLGLPLVLFLAGLGGSFLAGRALRPIDRITSTAESIRANDLARRIAHRGPADELGRLADTLDRMLDRLQDAFERERRFTADASHELRTPLAAIKGRVGVTLSQPRTTTDYESTLRDMDREVDRLIRLTNDLLLLARLDAGAASLQMTSVDLSSLLEAIIEQMRPLAELRGVALKSQIDSELFVRGDPDHLIRLFMNLLDNAIKYSLVEGDVGLHAQRVERDIRVSVRDSGPGIPAEHLPHLFERFYRVEAARSRDPSLGVGDGAGLGLAIAHEIARLHGGTLQVESETGRDTTFIVRLPTQLPSASAAS
jgi:heavy metal sensor kinase